MLNLPGIPMLNNLVQVSSTGRAISQFAKRHKLVYFGKVDHRYDEHAIVRGVTASAGHTDRHFAVGSIKGRDLSVLERTNTMSLPGAAATSYSWVIMQVDLRQSADVPHIFLDAYHYDEVFYSHLFMKFANLKSAASIFADHDPLFLQRFKAYAPADVIDELECYLTADISSMLAHHYYQFDYEIQGSAIYIYCNKEVVTFHDLEHMSQSGLWLAEQLEHSSTARSGHA